MKIISLDFETFKMDHLTGPTPKPVCLAVKVDNEDPYLIIGMKQMEAAWSDFMLQAAAGEALIVGQNFAFDMGVAVAHFPDAVTPTIAALNAAGIYDTMLAEKTMNLQSVGVIKEGFVKGVPMKFEYSLDELTRTYNCYPAGYAEMKKGTDAWRIRYGELDGVMLEAWPQAAVDYPKMDVNATTNVFHAQQIRADRMAAADDHHPFTSLPARVHAAFALRITGACGVKVDKTRREEARKASQAVEDSVTAFLIAEGIVRPAVPAQPYKGRGKEGKVPLNADGTPKMKKPEEESLDKKALVQRIIWMVEQGIIDASDIVLTDKALEDGEFKKVYSHDVLAAYRDFPEYVASSAEFMEEHAEKDPVLSAYYTRQSVQKVLSTELPRISPELPDKKGVVLVPEGQEWAGIAWPEYDGMKETGRSSSYASKLFPSLNAQNIAKEMRGVYRSHGDDRLLLSHDFCSMELVTAAQTCLNLFGVSKLSDLLKAGGDPHAYLGAQIAYAMWPFFKAVCDEEKADSKDARYQLFLALKKEVEMLPKWGSDPAAEIVGKDGYKHFRTLAKPTGLGLWGGLGAETFVTYAKTTFGVEITNEEAEDLIQIWHDTYPEAELFFNYLKENLADHKHTIRRKVTTRKTETILNGDGTKRKIIIEETKEKNFTKFAYTTAGGLRRVNADYCAAANGMTLQSPSAEGALKALYGVVCACLSAKPGDVFWDVLPYAFVHDEIICDLPEDADKIEAVSKELDRIMCAAFLTAAPDVPIRTEPGLMKWWSKAAGDDRYADGSLMTVEERAAGLTENPRKKSSKN